MRVAIAGFSGRTEEFDDDEVLVDRLRERGVEASSPDWDDPALDWERFDLVVARSPWDYSVRHREFLEWVDRVGPRLENDAALIRWNSDKHYLADLGADGVPVVETLYLEAGDELPPIGGEIVVKPTISGGARRTGRFGPQSLAAARELVELITADGGVAMVQPFVAAVERDGETAVVMIDGEVSHVLRKGAILAPDEVAPTRAEDALGVAEVMYDPELVLPSSATGGQLALARRAVAAVTERFGSLPLIARVDMLAGEEGSPVLLELEAIEPNLYFDQAPDAADRLADAIVARAGGRG